MVAGLGEDRSRTVCPGPDELKPLYRRRAFLKKRNKESYRPAWRFNLDALSERLLLVLIWIAEIREEPPKRESDDIAYIASPSFGYLTDSYRVFLGETHAMIFRELSI
jgi:hypothetical protein